MKKKGPSGGNFHYFLFFLVLLILIHPFLRTDAFSRVIVNLVLGAITASAVLAFTRRRRVLAIGIVLGFAAIASGVAEVLAPSRTMAITRQSFLALFLLFTAGVLLSRVLAAGQVTTAKLSGATSVFLLIGFIWASLFSVVELVAPGSIRVPEEEREEMVERLKHGEPNSGMFYFSFVTLTTTGYGDFSPVSDVARMLAWVEAMLGQLYLTILVARLVGMHLTHAGLARGP